MKTPFLVTLTFLTLNVLAQETKFVPIDLAKPRLVVPIGHFSRVTSVAFSPDGKRVLTGSWDGTAKLWDLSGRTLMTFTGHTGSVISVAFSPDGKQVLTGGWDFTAKLWDLSGRELTTFTVNTERVWSVAFSPDGKQVLTGGEDFMAKLWDLSGRELITFPCRSYFVFSVAFSPNGKQVLTGNQLWDLSGKELMTFSDTLVVTSVAFSPNGKQVLTGYNEGAAKLWDLSGKELMAFAIQAGHSYTNGSVAFSADGTQVLTGSGNGAAKLWDLSGKVLKTFADHSDRVTSVVFSPACPDDPRGGKQVLTRSEDGTAKLWDWSGKKLMTFSGHAEKVSSVSFSPDGKQVLTGCWDKTAKLWNLPDKAFHTFSGHTGRVTSVAFSPASPDDPRGGKQILTGSEDGTAKLWDISGAPLITFSKHTEKVNSVAFSPDGKQVLTGSWDQTAKLWDLSGKELMTFSGQDGSINSVAFSPDGKQVLTGSWVGTLWDLSGKEMTRFDPYSLGSIRSIAFSPGGELIFTAGDGDIGNRLWDLSGRQLRYFSGHLYHSGYSGAFSPDGKKVLTGSADGPATFWDLSGSELMTFQGHASMVTSVAFSPACPNDPVGGKLVLTGSGDNTTIVWNTLSGQTLATLIALDSNDWVVTAPSGLFDASPGAMNLMYFVVGKDLDVIELEQLKERYYEPGLLSKVMGFSDEPIREVEGFDSVALYPSIRLRLDTLQNKLHIHLSPRNGGVGKVSVFINDKEIIENANPLPRVSGKMRDTAITIELDKYARYFLLDSLNTVSIRAYNEAGWLKSAAQSVEYQPVFAKAKGDNNDQGANDEPSLKKRIPSLHILVVGSADYAGKDLDLQYAAKDARDMAGALEQIGRQLFIPLGGKVTVHLLTTDSSASDKIPTKANIKAAFEAIKKDDKAEDVVIVYFSGHGITYGDADRALFYYLTRDIGNFDLSDAGIREKRAISSDELTKWLNDTHARKQVLILDACNSGKVVEALATSKKELSGSQIRALDRMKDRTGMFVLAGSAANKVSYEAGQYGQGLLTYSLLQGIKGLAHPDDERVDVMKLFQYSCDEVPELAKGIGGIQTPMLVGPLKGSFDIGIKNDSVQITIAEPKPVFIRNVFQDEDSFDDTLGLTPALAGFFQEITTRGAQAELIYVDVSTYENAYSLKGLYKISGDAVVVRGRLFKGKTAVGEEFKVTGKKTDVPGLTEAIMEKVMALIK